MSDVTSYTSFLAYIHVLKYVFFSFVIAGTVLFYGLMQIAFIWVCHVCFIFWSVKFPISFMQFKSHKNMKFLHAVVICLMVVVPVIPVAAVFGTGGFINARFPPLLCLPKNNDAAFYGLLFPMSILLASGVSLMIGVFWTIRKVCAQH